ncbi:hypothetical protein BDB01DRAFT_854933 [Pilobolus umbonatus]|nr:hypothetical protein BDB01DRAFT_854933 [Pilobolus umbonatus]
MTIVLLLKQDSNYNINIIPDYIPCSTSLLNYLQYLSLPKKDKQTKITEIHQNHLIHTIKRTSSSHVQIALSRNFHKQQLISSSQELRSRTVPSSAATPSTITSSTATTQPSESSTPTTTPSNTSPIISTKDNKRIEATYRRFSELNPLFQQLSKLETALSNAQARIAELELQLTGVPSFEKKKKHTVDSYTHISENTPPTSSSPSYASIASSPPHKYTANKKALACSFLPVSTSQGFQYLYIHCRQKDPVSVMRAKLRSLGLQSSRILNIHYPDNNVVAILVHNDYSSTVKDTLTSSGICINTDFNPLSPTILRDHKYQLLPADEKLSKVIEIHQNRLQTVIRRTINPSTQRAFPRASLHNVSQLENPTALNSTDISMDDVASSFKPPT